MQNRLTVTIAGQKFSLVADEPEAYMKEIAALADKKIAEAKKLVGSTTFSTGVLATLNMADEAVKLRHQCDEYRTKAQSKEEELNRSKDEMNLMQDELETMRRARPDEDPAVLLAEIKRLEKELDNARSTHDAVCAESDAEMARLNDLIDTLTRDRDQAKAKLADIDALQMRIQALTRETQELREDLEKAQAERAAAAHEQENSLQSEIDQLNAALDALHVKESTQSAEAQDQIEALTREVETLRAARTDTEPLYAEIKNLQNALDAKEKQVSENVQLKEQIETLKHKLAENDPEPLRSEIKNLQKALDTKEKQVGENSRLKAQIEELDDRLKRNDPAPLYAQIRQLQAALDERRSQADENARLREEMQRLRDSYHDVRPVAEFEQLDQQLTETKAELSKAKIQLAGREIGEIGELRRELTRLRKLEQDYNNMEDPEPLHAEIDRLQEEVRKAHLETLEAEKKAAPQHDASDLEEIERLKQQLADAQQAPVQTETQLPAAEESSETDAPSAEMDALRAELKKVKAELNRQIQINQSQAPRGKKKKGGK